MTRPENPTGNTEEAIQQPHEVEVAVPFKPYEMATRFGQLEDKNLQIQQFLVPEEYRYTLLLRRELHFMGLQGVVDVISENPKGPHWPLEKPLGGAAFCYVGTIPDGFTMEEKPFILRFAFLLHNSSEYSKLLISYVRAKLGEEEYDLIWNWNRLGVKRNMQKLEAGEEIVVTQKDLFNVKEVGEGEATEEDWEKFENTEVGRLTFVWLPKDMDKFKTITLTFHQFDDGGHKDQPTEPIPPIPDRILVPAA